MGNYRLSTVNFTSIFVVGLAHKIVGWAAHTNDFEDTFRGDIELLKLTAQKLLLQP